MTKKELFEAVQEVCTKHEIDGEARQELEALVKPKKGGAKVDLADITLTDEDGNITHILDSVFSVYLPVFNEDGEPNFYEKPDTELGWSRYSRAAEKVRKDATKVFKATEKAVLKDLIDGEITGDEAKEQLEAAKVEISIPEGLEFINPDEV